MPKSQFQHVTDWVFDLDHTLYPPENPLFDQIETKMNDYIVNLLGIDAASADTLRKRYWTAYGTTLAGLMKEHDIDPVPFLREVHQIDFSTIAPNPALGEAIDALPGRKLIYTNGTILYANEVLNALKIRPVFNAIYGVESAGYHPKPQRLAFETVFGHDQTKTKSSAMFEDDLRNLVVPKQLGMRTILVSPSDERPAAHVDFVTTDLTAFLRQIV